MAMLSSTLAPRQFAPIARTGIAARSGPGLGPTGCSVWKWVKCGAIVATCLATAVGGPAAVAVCVAAGAADCVECL